MVLKHEEQEEIRASEDQASKTPPKPLSKVPVTPRANSKPVKVIAKLQENQRINYNYQYDLPKQKSKSNTFSSSPISKQLNNVVTILNEGFNMPKLELFTFDGNPLNYWRYINNFQTNIANETINPRKRLAYLIQHCKGEARDAIENCSILDPEDRYKKA